MQGLMMQQPLLVSSILRHADRVFPEVEMVSRDSDTQIHRHTYADLHRRCRQLAYALTAAQIAPGDRIATLAWNGFRHMELIYAVAGIGAICHTVNPRLFLDQIVYIINHAEDRLVFFDISFVPLVAQLAPRCPGVVAWILLGAHSAASTHIAANVLTYQDFLANPNDRFEWPRLDENSACGLCYTSGTTGNPKGVLYSQRSSVLHAMMGAVPDAVGVSALDCVMPITPMFHALAWGIPHLAPMMGAKLVLPGSRLDSESLYALCEAEGVTVTAAVPTLWFALVDYMREHQLKFSSLNRVLIGGSACPRSLIDTFQDEFGVRVIHGWGMTETSPLATTSAMKSKHVPLPAEQRYALQAKQGRPLFGVELKIVDANGALLPNDGAAAGDLLIRGPWIAASYFKGEGGDPLRDGWFVSGDVASIDADGYVQITDRVKDLVKSGGEWISSIDLENAAMAHPAIAEAAAIGVPHDKWTERPLLLAVLKPAATVTREEILTHYRGRVATWWIPDDVVFVDALPHTATGKLLKTQLREEYRSHRWPERSAR